MIRDISISHLHSQNMWLIYSGKFQFAGTTKPIRVP